MTKHLPCLIALAAIFLGSTLLADGPANPNVAQVTPEATIPLTSAEPKIDGVIAPGEWTGLHVNRFVSQGQANTLQARPGEFWLACDGKNLLIAVRSAVHPQAGAIVNEKPVKGGQDIGRVVHDDSIELWLDNDPGGDKGKYFQIIVNPAGALFDVMFDRKTKTAATYWRPAGFQQAHKVADGVWTAEFAIPLKDLEITDPGKTLAMRVCRNYKYPWDQSRWSVNVIGFDSPETMGKVRFVASAPAVSEEGFQDADGVDIRVAVENPTDKPLPVKVKLGYNAENQPRYYKDFSETLKPGESKQLAYKDKFFTTDDYPALGEILVTSPDGKTVYYHRDFRWRTQPKDLWQPVGGGKAEEVTQFDIEWHPTPKILRWRTDFAGAKGREDIKQARVEVVAEGGKKVKDQAIQEFKGFATEQQLELKDLPDGKYEARLYLDGATPADKPIRSAVFHQYSDFAWLNNKIGVSDEVIPPFEPLKVEGEGNGATVSAVLRKYKVNGIGLWDSIQADGEEILAGPIRLEDPSGWKVVEASLSVAAQLGEGRTKIGVPPSPAVGKTTFAQARPNKVVTLSTWVVGDLKGSTSCEYDYDGCMKVTLVLEPTGGKEVKALDLVIPLKNDQAPLMHTCGDGLRFNYGGVVPAGEGEVWNSKQASRIDIVGTFLPYIFVGGEKRGLCWFASSDSGWVVDQDEKTQAMALERKGDALNLRIRLIQKPAVLDGKRKIVFGLMATPAKPMSQKPQWQRLGLAGPGDFRMQILGMCMYWGGQLYGVFPVDRDFTIVQKIAETAKQGVDNRKWFDEYNVKHPGTKNEVNWSANQRNLNAVVPYTNIRGALTYTKEWVVYQNEWRKDNFPGRQTALDKTSGAVDFSVALTPSRRDFLLYYYREFLKNGFDGIYWDNICIYSDSNPVNGDGYYLPDGRFQPEADIWAIRDVTRRTAVLCHQMGKPNVNVPHMTNAYLIPAFSWTGVNLDWEWQYGMTDFQDRFTRPYIRAASLGLQGGNLSAILPGVRGSSDANAIRWCERTRTAVCLPHEITIWQTDQLYNKVRQYLWDNGYGTDKCKVYHYWDREPVVKVEGLDGIWIAFETDKDVILMVTDYGDGGDAKITLDAKRLGLPASFTAVNWENPDDKPAGKAGTFTAAKVKKHDFRLYTIAK